MDKKNSKCRISKLSDLLSVIFSLAALCFSVYTYMVHNNDLIESKQIDLMVELVEQIQQQEYDIYTPKNLLVNNARKDSVKVMNLFELSDSTLWQDIDHFRIGFVTPNETCVDFKKFINNPLMPTDISRILKKYEIINSYSFRDYESCMDHVIIITKHNQFDKRGIPHIATPEEFKEKHNFDNGVTTDGYIYYVPDADTNSIFKKFKSLKENNRELRDAIKNWFKDHKMKNVSLL